MTPMRSGTPTLVGACLLWLSTLMFVAIFAGILGALLPPASPVPARLLVLLGVACAMMLAAAATLHDRAVVWQTPLRGFAVAATLAGAAHLIRAAFENRAFLWSPAGALC